MALPLPLGPFHLLEPIGRGGMGEVWRGVHAAEQVPVAVKLVTAWGADREQAAFRNEVRAVAALDHPNLVVVHDHGRVPPDVARASEGRLPEGAPWLAMELVDGGSAARRAPTSWAGLRDLLLCALDALGHAHARGVVHRDVKLGNVLWSDARNTWKLTDFGLAHAIGRGADDARSDDIVHGGTPAYMAPEQFAGEVREWGPWTDLYALACVAWRVATGAPPFPQRRLLAAAHAHLTMPPPAFAPRFPVPDGLEAWLRRGLQKAPEDRWCRAADAAWALLQLGDVPGSGGVAQALSEEAATVLAAPVARVGGRASVTSDASALAVVPPPFPYSWERPGQSTPSLAGVGLGLYGLRAIPIVGRSREQDTLWGALRDVHATGRPAAIVLRGPAGVGKSRLAAWLSQRAHELGAAEVLEATHAPQPTGGEGLGPMIARHLRCRGLPREEVAERLERLEAPALDRLALTELIHPSEGGRIRFGSARERRTAVRRHLGRLASRRPVVVRLDDVHWGPDAIALADEQLASPTRAPVLFVLTVREDALATRPDAASRLSRLLAHERARELPVEALGPSDRRALVHGLLGLDPELATRVEARTGGNPLFAVQLVGDWVQRGLLVPGPRGFRLRDGVDVEIPDDLHAVWSARLAQVLSGRPAQDRRALEIAAALGQGVDTAEWRAACGAAGVDAPLSLVETLIGRRLARSAPDGPGQGWSFGHAMLRESVERAAREGGRWADAHRACAGVVATDARRGRHLHGAHHLADAIDVLLDAARKASSESDWPEVHDLLTLRDDALSRLGVPEADERWGAGWVERARAWLEVGQLDRCEREVRRVEDTGARAGWGEPLARAPERLGHVALRRGRIEDAELHFRVALDRFGALDHAAGIARAQRGIAWACMHRGQLDDAERWLHEARRIQQRIGYGLGLADTLRGLGDVARLRRDWGAAERWYTLAFTLAPARASLTGSAELVQGLAEVRRYRGDLDGAERLYRRSLSIQDASGSDPGVTRINLGLVLLERGAFDEARRVLDDVRAAWERERVGAWLGCVLVALLPCAASDRDWEAWDDWIGRAHAILDDAGLVDPDIARPLTLAGDLARAAGEGERARAAWTLARAQWVALDAAADLDAVDARLAGR